MAFRARLDPDRRGAPRSLFRLRRHDQSAPCRRLGHGLQPDQQANVRSGLSGTDFRRVVHPQQSDVTWQSKSQARDYQHHGTGLLMASEAQPEDGA